jgi:hypothetical protein
VRRIHSVDTIAESLLLLFDNWLPDISNLQWVSQGHGDSTFFYVKPRKLVFLWFEGLVPFKVKIKFVGGMMLN